MTAAERVVVDRGRATDAWHRVHDGFGNGVVERSRQAARAAAVQQLGLHDLERMGVIP
jgi:hypothetical protein